MILFKWWLVLFTIAIMSLTIALFFPPYISSKGANKAFKTTVLYYCPKQLKKVPKIQYILSSFFDQIQLVQTPSRLPKPTNNPRFVLQNLNSMSCHNWSKKTLDPNTYFIGHDAGEISHTNQTIHCNKVHFLLDRSAVRVKKGCIGLHYLQGYTSALVPPGPDVTPALLPKKFQRVSGYKIPVRLTSQQALRAFKKKKNLCVLASTRLSRRGHSADALVRMAFWYLLSKRSGVQCHGTTFISNDRLPFKPARITCKGSHLDTYRCLQPYKFVISMENKSELGYISEKIFTGILSNAVPIYFGAPDIGNYMNVKRFIHCQISPRFLMEFRKHKRWKPGYSFYSLQPLGTQNKTFIDKHQLKTIDILKWAASVLEGPLEKCLNETLYVWKHPSVYVRKLQEQPMWERDLVNSRNTLSKFFRRE